MLLGIRILCSWENIRVRINKTEYKVDDNGQAQDLDFNTFLAAVNNPPRYTCILHKVDGGWFDILRHVTEEDTCIA